MNNYSDIFDEEFRQLQIIYLESTIDNFNNFLDMLIKNQKLNKHFDVNETFRLIHSLKGAAGSYGFNIFTKTAANFENVLAAVRDKKIPLTDDITSFTINVIEIIVDTFTDVKGLFIQNLDYDLLGLKLLTEYEKSLKNCHTLVNFYNKSAVKAVLPAGKEPEKDKEKTREKIDKPAAAKKNSNGIRSAVLVYNSKFVKNILSTALKNKDYEVFETKSGIEALNKLYEKSYNLLITSQVIEKLSGQAVCASVKLTPDLNGTKVVFITSEKKVKFCAEIEPDYFLTVDDNLGVNIEKILKEIE